MMKDYIKNLFMSGNKYKTNDDAVIISCYFNPLHSEYRKKAFDLFYDSIKHLNHRIVECVIGNDLPELTEIKFPYIEVVHTKSLLWHKESLLNYLIKKLPLQYKYVFWLDADVLFTNKNWLIDSVEVLQTKKIMQPFTYCFHLDKDELEYVEKNDGIKKNWKSFCGTFNENPNLAESENYNEHGHVGFAWGARREILDSFPLYDKALIGGADHIMAHAAAGHIPHKCITKSFTDNIDEINKWSNDFYYLIDGNIGSISGNLYHIWHGEIQKRDYLKRVQDFTKITKEIQTKDQNGLYESDFDDTYMTKYFISREVTPLNPLFDPLNTTLNDNPIQFGGGEFGGAGAGGSWSDGQNSSVNPINEDSNVFTDTNNTSTTSMYEPFS